MSAEPPRSPDVSGTIRWESTPDGVRALVPRRFEGWDQLWEPATLPFRGMPIEVYRVTQVLTIASQTCAAIAAFALSGFLQIELGVVFWLVWNAVFVLLRVAASPLGSNESHAAFEVLAGRFRVGVGSKTPFEAPLGDVRADWESGRLRLAAGAQRVDIATTATDGELAALCEQVNERAQQHGTVADVPAPLRSLARGLQPTEDESNAGEPGEPSESGERRARQTQRQ